MLGEGRPVYTYSWPKRGTEFTGKGEGKVVVQINREIKIFAEEQIGSKRKFEPLNWRGGDSEEKSAEEETSFEEKDVKRGNIRERTGFRSLGPMALERESDLFCINIAWGKKTLIWQIKVIKNSSLRDTSK